MVIWHRWARGLQPMTVKVGQWDAIARNGPEGCRMRPAAREQRRYAAPMTGVVVMKVA